MAASEVCANFLSASSTSSASGSGSVSPSAGGRQTPISWEVNYIQEFHDIQRQSLKMVKWTPNQSGLGKGARKGEKYGISAYPGGGSARVVKKQTAFLGT